MPSLRLYTPPITVAREYYTLTVWDMGDSWHIRMIVHGLPLTTHSFPKTVRILKQLLPSIFTNMCFNEKHQPFKKEVQQTEVGHLFEHILLEYLCMRKLARGSDDVEFSGHTDWNWKKDARGTFHIHISKDQEDAGLLPTSLKLAIALFERIIYSERMFVAAQNADSVNYLRFRNLFVS